MGSPEKVLILDHLSLRQLIGQDFLVLPNFCDNKVDEDG